MAGNKNSGRRSYQSLIRSGELLKVCTDYLIDNFASFDQETKVKVALFVAPKNVSDKISHEGLAPQAVKIVHNYVNTSNGTTNGRISDQVLTEADQSVGNPS